MRSKIALFTTVALASMAVCGVAHAQDTTVAWKGGPAIHQ